MTEDKKIIEGKLDLSLVELDFPMYILECDNIPNIINMHIGDYLKESLKGSLSLRIWKVINKIKAGDLSIGEKNNIVNLNYLLAKKLMLELGHDYMSKKQFAEGIIVEVAKVMELGAKEYGKNNWKNCKPEDVGVYLRALERHNIYYPYKGEIRDSKSGLLHSAHALTNGLFLYWFFERDSSEEFQRNIMR